MTCTGTPELPGRTTVARLQEELRRALDRPHLVIDDVACTPIGHAITAPSTASLTRVRVVGHDAQRLELALVAKCLQPAARGLPPAMPREQRERLAAAIPWRLEAEIHCSDTA